MAQDIPQWAIERVKELTGGYWQAETIEGHPVTKCFAAYIAAHEEPPVDPLLIEARKLAASDRKSRKWDLQARMIMLGKRDDEAFVRLALAGLKRGIELAKSEQSS